MRNVIREYGDYLKDNPQGYWFKRKLYGWGWVPARWQGWAVIALFVLYAGWVAQSVHVDKDPSSLGIKVVIGVAVLIGVCYWKGEKPKWQWGTRDDS